MGQVLLTKEGSVAVVTISAPEVKNGLTPEMGREMVAVCDSIDGDSSVGAAVVVGEAGTFCSGADRRRWRVDDDQAADQTYKDAGAVYGAFVRLGSLCVPSIAAVRGAVVGAGLNLMLATDLRIVSRDARILAGFLKIGIHPGGGYFTLSGRLAGREATAAMGLFGEEIDGLRAAALGIAWEACEDTEVEGRAMQLAQRVAKDPELAREATRSLRTELGPPAMPWSVALQFERATQMWSLRRREDA